MIDMKCPVCNVGYVHESVNHWCCDNEFCPSYDETSSKTYDVLIRTRKALYVAVDALKEQQRWLGIIRISMVSHLNNEKGTVFQPYDADPTVLNIGKAKVLLNNALEQINQKEQQ